MSKVRVYELARELNLESKELVRRLVAGGMNISNYMSTLDEAGAAKAKEIVTGTSDEVVEEKRVRPTVIRRRKKVRKIEEEVPQKKVEAEAGEEVSEAAGEEEVAAKEVRQKEEIAEKGAQAGPEDEAEVETEPESLKEAVSEAKPSRKGMDKGAKAVEEREGERGVPEAEEKKKVKAEPTAAIKGKKRKKTRKEEPAKIISRPEETKTPEEVVEKEKEEIEEKPPEIPAAPEVFEVGGKKEEEDWKKTRKKKKDKKKGPARDEEEFFGPVQRGRSKVYEKSDLYGGRSPRAAKVAKEGKKKQGRTEITVPKAIKRKLRVQEAVSVSELARAIGIKANELIKQLMEMGVMVNINQSLDFETASLLAYEYGYELELDTFEEEVLSEEEDKPEDLLPRPPVVTIMGHVDHGKTSLLDYIRRSNIIGNEFGGITQHIGAYDVKTEEGEIVFLDTPGHEAFTAMRARGAKVTDIIVLVVAADDGVMPQTKEAINHARAAEIPIIVAINKIDKPEADLEKVNREMSEQGLIPEEWGGDTLFGNISAKTGEGIEELLSLILLQSEMLELKANPKARARGVIVEAKLDKKKGPVATVLVKKGTLHPGDFFVCGEQYGRVRAMLNHMGEAVESAGPSIPVEIYGMSGVPMAGDELVVVKEEKTAKKIVEHRKGSSRQQEVGGRGLASLDELYARIKEGSVKELGIVLKADVQGSLEALIDSLEKLGTDEVKVKIIHSATGAVTESDIMLASASGAIVVAFNVRTDVRTKEIAEKQKVSIRHYEVIYNVIEDIKSAMAGMLEPEYEEEVIGRADIKETFRIPKVGAVAGCRVVDGYIDRNANVRLLRDDVVVFDGKISSLKRFKEDVKEVPKGYECGLGLENFQDIKPGDVFEAYKVKKVEAEL